MFRILRINIFMRRSAVKAWGAAALLAALPTLVQAQAAGEWRSPQHIFQQTCAFCHTTGVGPELRGRQLPPEYVSYVMLNGLRAMPAFRPTDFSPAEVAAMAKMLNESPAPAAAKNGAAAGAQIKDAAPNSVGVNK
jgi:mono/diheme cytochrome c family protein